MNNIRVATLFVILLISSELSMGSFIEKLVFSDKKYKKNIRVSAFVVSEKNVQKVFREGKDDEFGKETNGELFDSHVYFIIRLKNIGNQSVSGKLKCKVNWIRIPVEVYSLPPSMEKWNIYVIPLGIYRYTKVLDPNDVPDVSLEWESLYVK